MKALFIGGTGTISTAIVRKLASDPAWEVWLINRGNRSDVVPSNVHLIKADVSEEEDPPIEDIPPEVIQQMVRQLPTGYRTVFNLYVFEDKSHQEIAQLLGTSVKTSISQLHKAKNLLAQMIQTYHDNKRNAR